MINNRKAFTGLLVAGILAVIVGAAMLYIGLFINATLSGQFDSTLSPASATGSLTFSGNTSCGEYVNITTGASVLVPLYFNLSSGCSAAPGGVATVSLAAGGNTSTFSASNLSAAINGNATLSAILTASNSSAGVVLLTYDTTGTAGNAVATTETAANAAWGATTLTGGQAGNSAWAGTKNNVNTAFVILGLALLVGGFGVVIYTLRTGFISGGEPR